MSYVNSAKPNFACHLIPRIQCHPRDLPISHDNFKNSMCYRDRMEGTNHVYLIPVNFNMHSKLILLGKGHLIIYLFTFHTFTF